PRLTLFIVVLPVSCIASYAVSPCQALASVLSYGLFPGPLFPSSPLLSRLNHDCVAARGDSAVDAGVDARAELACIRRGDKIALVNTVAGFDDCDCGRASVLLER